jgi:hypothetical protein
MITQRLKKMFATVACKRKLSSLIIAVLSFGLMLGVGPCSPFVTDPGLVAGVSEFGGNLYYSTITGNTGYIKRVPASGGAGVVLATLAVQPDLLIKTDGDGIFFEGFSGPGNSIPGLYKLPIPFNYGTETPTTNSPTSHWWMETYSLLILQIIRR